MGKRQYHGWIVDARQEGGTDVYVEFEENGKRERISMGNGEEGAKAAAAWWDARVGQEVGLLRVPGGYRVYTEAPQAQA